ncbi:TPA: hypothetical protein H1012_01315 [archaeon]|nr:hypothetical protein [Candidatus Naiadarchaeales archaeon SRR2090159.bin1288]
MGILHKSIQDLDIIFAEDIEREPVGYSFLIVAGAGRGKTTFAYQMMHDYVTKLRGREFAIYITFEQSAKRLKEQFSRLKAFKENPGIVIIDEPFMKQVIRGKAQDTKKKVEEIEKNLETLKGEVRKKSLAAKFIDKIDELKTGMDALYENAEHIPFGKGEDYEQKAEVEILKKREDVSIDVKKALILGKLAGELGELAEREHSVREILSQFKANLELYSKLASDDVFNFIEFVVEDTIARAQSGDLEEMGIPKTAKLGCITVDSMQIVEAEQGISENPDAIRKEMKRFVRPLTEKYHINLIGLLELRPGQTIEHIDKLPEAYAFDTTIALEIEPALDDPHKPLYKIYVGKHRGRFKKRFWVFEVKEGEGIVLAPEN